MSDQNENVSTYDGYDGTVDITELINPFPGLRPFGVEESHLFFGREGQSDEALQKLSDNRFAAILGASGSGKSSFVFCGLIPTLHGGFMTHAGSNWNVVTCRPGGGPIDNLAEALLIKDPEYHALNEEDKLIKKTIIGTVLRSSSLGLVEVIKQLKTVDFQNVLILVDQFEELFRFSKMENMQSDQNESAAFVNLLLEACHHLEEPIYVALTMRSDFIGECAKYPELTQMINDSHYLIPQMTRDQKRMIIEGPVAVGGGIIQPRLTQQLLNDLGDNPDQLPILQHALMRTWQYWVDHRKEDEPMDLRHYQAIGTLREALSQHANEAYDSLNKREKEICEIMFKALTERGSENQGIRRPTKMSTLAAIAGVSEDEIERIVDRFREPGRSLLMPPYGVRLESDTVIDISHESLMRIWDRLKIWLDEESRAAEMYMKLSEAATKYQEGKASLWKMPDLQLALNWREENNPTLVWGSRYNQAYERTMVFLETSEKAHETEQANKILLQKRKVQFVRIFAIVSAAIAVGALFLVVFANLKAKEAERQKIVAQEQEQAAIEAAAEARRQETIAIQQKEAADEARAEADKQRVAAEAAKVEADKQRDIAIEQERQAIAAKNEADEQRKEAERQKEEADRQKGIAEEQTIIAKQEEENARRLRFQAVAQSMAIKAKGVADPELKGLVAKQGFDFYQEFKDPNKEYNGDVYAGAYYGLQGLLQNSIYLENIESMTREQAEMLGDSTLNEYHGHKPQNGDINKQVAVRSVTFSADGNSMYSAGGDGRLLKWDVATRTYEEVYKNNKVNRVVNISKDERYLAIATNENEIDLFDLRNPESEVIGLESHRGPVVDLVFLPDNSGFISVGIDRQLLFNDFKKTTLLTNTLISPTSMSISPKGDLLAISSRTGEIHIYDLNEEELSPRQILRDDAENLGVEAIEFNNAGNILAIGGSHTLTGLGYVTLWDLDKKQSFGPDLKGFTSSVSDIDFSKDDKLVAVASKDYSVRMWDMDPDNIFDLPTVFDDHEGWVWAVDFHPDGNSLMTASADGLIRSFQTKPDSMIEQMCGLLSRNMNSVEWRQFVAKEDDIPYRITCDELPVPKTGTIQEDDGEGTEGE
jgi:WD40 repeat protein